MTELPSKPSTPTYKHYRFSRTNPFTLFYNGFLAPLRVLIMMFRRPSLWGKAVLPVLINIAFFLLIANLAIIFADDVAGWLWTRPESGFMLWLWRLLALVSGIVLLVVGFLICLIMIGPLASPFLEKLSRVVESDWLGKLATPGFRWSSFLPGLPSLLGIALTRLVKYLFLTLPVLALALVPMVGPPLAVALEFVITGIFLAVQFMDFPLGRRDYSRKEKAGFIKSSIPALVGLGLALGFMLLIPFASLVVIPIGIQAGTLVFLGLEDVGRVPKLAPELEAENENGAGPEDPGQAPIDRNEADADPEA